MLSGLQEHIAVRWQETESAITGEHIYEIGEKMVEDSVIMPILFYQVKLTSNLKQPVLHNRAETKNASQGKKGEMLEPDSCQWDTDGRLSVHQQTKH